MFRGRGSCRICLSKFFQIKRKGIRINKQIAQRERNEETNNSRSLNTKLSLLILIAKLFLRTFFLTLLTRGTFIQKQLLFKFKKLALINTTLT